MRLSVNFNKILDFPFSILHIYLGFSLVAANYVYMYLFILQLERMRSNKSLLIYIYFILFCGYCGKELFSTSEKPALLQRLPEQRGAPWMDNSEGRKELLFFQIRLI